MSKEKEEKELPGGSLATNSKCDLVNWPCDPCLAGLVVAGYPRSRRHQRVDPGPDWATI